MAKRRQIEHINNKHILYIHCTEGKNKLKFWIKKFKKRNTPQEPTTHQPNSQVAYTAHTTEYTAPYKQANSTTNMSKPTTTYTTTYLNVEKKNRWNNILIKIQMNDSGQQLYPVSVPHVGLHQYYYKLVVIINNNQHTTPSPHVHKTFQLTDHCRSLVSRKDIPSQSELYSTPYIVDTWHLAQRPSALLCGFC